jgi:hypothetical protein
MPAGAGTKSMVDMRWLVGPSSPNDGDLFDKLLDWCDNDEDLWKRILVDTPTKLYGFNG